MSRWSRIAQILPGRTDNEIKNYWRTHMRKKAQGKKCTMSLASSSSKSSSSTSNEPTLDPLASKDSGVESFHYTGGSETSALMEIKSKEDEIKREHAMDEIWREIAQSEENTIIPASRSYSEEGHNFFYPQIGLPTWEYCADSQWKIDDEECKMFPSIRDPLFSYHGDIEYLCGWSWLPSLRYVQDI